MSLILLLVSARLFASSIIIDSGSPSDRFFTGGTAFPSAGADTTLRFSSLPFAYKVPVEPSAYIVKLNFFEPSATPTNRAFSVAINDQMIFQRLTTPGPHAAFSRSAIVMDSDGFINIVFTTIIRSAVISSIEITPFKEQIVTGAVAVWNADAYYVPRPDSVPDLAVPLHFYNVSVYRNGIRQQIVDVSSGPSTTSQLKLVPQGGQKWPDADTLLVDYYFSFVQ